MKTKLIRHATIAVTACILSACMEEEIAPSLSRESNTADLRGASTTELSSVAARKAHLQQLSRGLVAYYPFNGNANDQSGNGLNGVVNGATLASDRYGAVNSAYSFDGDDYISVADNDLLDFEANENFSISLWVEIAATQNLDGGINDILRKWSGDAQGYPFSISFLNEASSEPEKLLIARYDGYGCGTDPPQWPCRRSSARRSLRQRSKRIFERCHKWSVSSCRYG